MMKKKSNNTSIHLDDLEALGQSRRADREQAVKDWTIQVRGWLSVTVRTEPPN